MREPFHEKPVKVPVSMNHTDEFDSIFQEESKNRTFPKPFDVLSIDERSCSTVKLRNARTPRAAGGLPGTRGFILPRYGNRPLPVRAKSVAAFCLWGLIWAVTVCVPARARTIDLILPEFSSPAALPVPWHVGMFSFQLGQGETILSATLSGGFGNSKGPVLPLATVYADGFEVGQMPSGPVIQIIPFPWEFTFSQLSLPLLADGRLVIREASRLWLTHAYRELHPR